MAGYGPVLIDLQRDVVQLWEQVQALSDVVTESVARLSAVLTNHNHAIELITDVLERATKEDSTAWLARLDYISMDGYGEYACGTCSIEQVMVGDQPLPDLIRELARATPYQEVVFQITVSDLQVSGPAHPWKSTD